VFFFQAEDGIRDRNVTGVQTCALPILLALPAPMAVLNAGIGGNRVLTEGAFQAGVNAVARFDRDVLQQSGVTHVIVLEGINDIRSEERRVGKGCRYRWLRWR